MMVRSLGYDDRALLGTWPENYVTKAITLGLYKDVKVASGTANRGDIALMVYELFEDNDSYAVSEKWAKALKNRDGKARYELIVFIGRCEIWRITVMIDIVFSDSACASLKMAQHYGEGKYQGGSMGIFVSHADGSKPTKEEIETAGREAKEKARLAWENATPLGGKTSDIYGFNLMLSIGDISENQPSIKRKQTLEHLYSVYPNDEGRQAAIEILNRANKDLKTIRERVAAGEYLRIWYSNQPDEMCGLYWFMGHLNQWNVYDGQVSIIKLPEWEADGKRNIVRKNSWSDVAPEEWQRYLSLQNTVLPVFIHCCVSWWQELQADGAPLRAMLNGRLVSMSENLYDDFIFREIEAEGKEFQEAMIIGRVLGKYQLGIGDSWVAFRIEEMINAGKLEAVTAHDKDMPIYRRVLKKCTH